MKTKEDIRKEMEEKLKNTTPEQIKRMETNSKIFKYFLIPVILISVLLAFLPSDDETKEKEKTEVITTPTLPGIMPVDVYMKMEKQGFSKEANYGGEYGKTWTNKRNYAGIDYEVVTFSYDNESVVSVRATAMIDPATSGVKKPIATITQGTTTYKILAPSDVVRMLDIRVI